MSTQVPKFSIAKEHLLTALQTVQNAVSLNRTLPILGNVKIQTAEDKVFFTTTNLDITISTSTSAQIKVAGETTLPVKKLSAIIRELTSAQVELETDPKHITTVRSGQSLFKMHGIPGDEFPPLPRLEGASVFTLKQGDIKAAIRKTAYAMSSDETRYVLNGMYFSLENSTLTVVTTDGRRLAQVELELETPAPEPLNFILPSKCITELGRLLKDEGTLQLSLGENQITIDIGTTRIISKLVEGTYPNYKQVIPGSANERITIERQSLLSVIDRVAILATDKHNSIKLSFSNNNIEITANTPDIGQANESIPVPYKGPEMQISFNPEYLSAPLRALTEDEVFLELIDNSTPAVLKTHLPFLHVLMPIRVQ